MNKKRSGNRGLIAAVVAAFILLAGSRELVSFMADWLFFREVGFGEVFAKTFQAKLLSGLSFGVFAFLMIFINLRIASRRAFSLAGLNPLWERVPQLRDLDLDRVLRWLSLGLSLFAVVFAFPVGSGYWEQALLFLNSTPAGLADPLFGKDVSFYFFTYPFVDALNIAARSLIVAAALLVLAVSVVRGGIVFIGTRLTVERAVKRHLGILAALFLLSLSASFLLDRYGLLTVEHGVLYGASYADVHARLPMLLVMALLTALAAVAVPVLTARGSLAVPLASFGLLIAAFVLGLQVYPSTMQSFKVSPNEIVLEQFYFRDYIVFIRFGYGLENMEL